MRWSAEYTGSMKRYVVVSLTLERCKERTKTAKKRRMLVSVCESTQGWIISLRYVKADQK